MAGTEGTFKRPRHWNSDGISVLHKAWWDIPICTLLWDFPGRSDDKESAYNAGDRGSIPGSGRSPREGNDNLLQYSCLENPMDRGVWQAIVHTVHGVPKNRTLTAFCYWPLPWTSEAGYTDPVASSRADQVGRMSPFIRGNQWKICSLLPLDILVFMLIWGSDEAILLQVWE